MQFDPPASEYVSQSGCDKAHPSIHCSPVTSRMSAGLIYSNSGRRLELNDLVHELGGDFY